MSFKSISLVGEGGGVLVSKFSVLIFFAVREYRRKGTTLCSVVFSKPCTGAFLSSPSQATIVCNFNGVLQS